MTDPNLKIAEAALGAGNLETFRWRARAMGSLVEQRLQAKAMRQSLAALQHEARDLHDRVLATASAACTPEATKILRSVERDLAPFLGDLWDLWGR